MKIDKVLFSTSKEFSVCWNLNSRVWRTKLGIEPVCLLFAKKSETDVSEEYGKVIEMPLLPEIPFLIQLTWSRFYHVLSEPDTTWTLADMDIVPLQRYWFTDLIKDVPDDHYAHLDADAIVQMSGDPRSWTGRGQITAANVSRGVQHETNLPAFYHTAKGSTFARLREKPASFEEEIRYILDHGEYRNSRAFRSSDPIDQQNLWCSEERRSTEMVRQAIIAGRITFTGFSIPHGIARSTGNRIDRSTLKDEETDRVVGEDYAYDADRLRRGEYVDLHLARPFATYMPQSLKALRLAGMIE